MNITIIILSILLVASVVFNVCGCKTNSKLLIENKTLKWQSSLVHHASIDDKPLYTTVKGFGKYEDGICVVRISIQEGQFFNTLIKAFTDEDEHFNILEAEELIEHLNSK